MSEAGHKLVVLHSDTNFRGSHKLLQLWCSIKVINPRPQYWFSSQQTECYISLGVMGIISISIKLKVKLQIYIRKQLVFFKVIIKK